MGFWKVDWASGRCPYPIRVPVLASLLNLATAMKAIQLPSKTPLDYFKEIEWDTSLAQDRFFAFADKILVDQVRQAAAQGEFAPEASPGLFHPGATSSFKQVQFGAKAIDGVACVELEPDIDYFQDPLAHALLEVIPNAITHGLTDPKQVHVLRWIAGKHAGVPEFNPQIRFQLIDLSRWSRWLEFANLLRSRLGRLIRFSATRLEN